MPEIKFITSFLILPKFRIPLSLKKVARAQIKVTSDTFFENTN